MHNCQRCMLWVGKWKQFWYTVIHLFVKWSVVVPIWSGKKCVNHKKISDLKKCMIRTLINYNSSSLIFVLPGECVQNRASLLKRFTQSGSVLSGDGPGPGWAHRGIWQVQSLIILLCQMRTTGIIKEALPYLHTRSEETSSTQHWIKIMAQSIDVFIIDQLLCEILRKLSV